MSENFQYQIVAFAIASGKPIAYGVNAKRYIRGMSTFSCSTHAEVALLKKMGKRIRGCRVYVYRFNNSSAPDARTPKNARPCLLCQHELRDSGVSKVIYLNDNGETHVLKNKDMARLKGHPSNITALFMSRIGSSPGVKFLAANYVIT